MKQELTSYLTQEQLALANVSHGLRQSVNRLLIQGGYIFSPHACAIQCCHFNQKHVCLLGASYRPSGQQKKVTSNKSRTDTGKSHFRLETNIIHISVLAVRLNSERAAVTLADVNFALRYPKLAQLANCLIRHCGFTDYLGTSYSVYEHLFTEGGYYVGFTFDDAN